MDKRKQFNPFLRNVITGLYIFAFWILLPIFGQAFLTLGQKRHEEIFSLVIKAAEFLFL
jgi:hypothetical protein